MAEKEFKKEHINLDKKDIAVVEFMSFVLMLKKPSCNKKNKATYTFISPALKWNSKKFLIFK
jgi:hypothetical protein